MAVDAMRKAFEDIDIDGTIVIDESGHGEALCFISVKK